MAPRGPFAAKTSPSMASTIPTSRSGGRGSAASDISERSVRSMRSSRSSGCIGQGRCVEGYGGCIDDSSSICSGGGGGNAGYGGYGTGASDASSVQSGTPRYAEGYGTGLGSPSEVGDYCRSSPALDSKLMQEGVDVNQASSYAPSNASTERVKKTNKATRSHSMGNMEGYHGVRPNRQNTNKRIFGLSPCMRSCVDEVVFGRDVDGSTSKDHSAETHHLLSLYEGAAGGHREAAALLIDDQDGGVPDKVRPPALRPAHKIEERGLQGYAGLHSLERGNDQKRTWRNLPQHKSSISEVVYGKCPVENSALNDKDMLMVNQSFGHSAGKSPRFRHGELHGFAAGKVDQKDAATADLAISSKRNYYHSPMHKAQMERMVSNAEVRPPPDGHHERLLKQFEGAAGISERFTHEPLTRKARVNGPAEPSYCVFRKASGGIPVSA